ncbi:hypothetical protein [Longispora urticae]
MTTRRWTSAVALSAALTAGLLAGTGGSASATPSGCSYTLDLANRTASSYCSGGTGQHRIWVLEKHFLAEVGYIPVWGPWVAPGEVSFTRIPQHTVVDIRVQFQ